MVLGYRFAGISCGIKKEGKKDLGLVYSQVPAVVAGCFTTNKVKSSSILYSIKRLRKGKIGAILVNSGNANTGTGKEGEEVAEKIMETFARKLSLKKEEVIFLSTGRIGIPLPGEKIVKSIPTLFSSLSDSSDNFSEAILTTDRKKKQILIRTGIKGRKKEVVIEGIVKGAGMICPNMATMLAFLVTDAVISPSALKCAIQSSVSSTFNLINIDQDESPNDAVIILANGLARNRRIKEGDENYSIFLSALNNACQELSRMIASDGEGAKKLIEVEVRGAWSEKDARRIAKKVVGSNLVKTAIGGSSTNWGRILSSLGSVRVRINLKKLIISLQGITMFENGKIAKFPDNKLKKRLKETKIKIGINLGIGKGTATSFGCDLTEEYVQINQK